MMWSKLKQRIEEGFANSAKGRVEVWSTRYRNSHDQEGEAWITLDKTRIHSMGTLTYLVESFERNTQHPCEQYFLDYQDSQKIQGYRDAQQETDRDLRDQGILPLEGFNRALLAYLNLSIDDILDSDEMIVRALGMFDRRLGKRRLNTMDVSKDHELVQNFFRIRCALEGMTPARRA